MLAHLAMPALLMTLAAAGNIVFPSSSEELAAFRGTTPPTTRQMGVPSRNGADSPPCPAMAPMGATEDSLNKNCFTIDDADDFINVYSALDQQCGKGFVRMHDSRCLRALPITKLRSKPPKPPKP